LERFIWVLKENGGVFQYLINTKFDKKEEDEDANVEGVKNPRKIEVLKGISQISAEDDHFVVFNNEGNTWGHARLWVLIIELM